MNELQIFNNPEFGSIRTVEIDGVPWLGGKDVALALGYKNPQEAIRTHIDTEDKGVSEILTPRWDTETPHYQRIRHIQPYPGQQAAGCMEAIKIIWRNVYGRSNQGGLQRRQACGIGQVAARVPGSRRTIQRLVSQNVRIWVFRGRGLLLIFE